MTPFPSEELPASIVAYLDKLARDICPVCDTPVENQRQVGRCVYAVPCGHRLYQGEVANRFKNAIPTPKRMEGF